MCLALGSYWDLKDIFGFYYFEFDHQKKGVKKEKDNDLSPSPQHYSVIPNW